MAKENKLYRGDVLEVALDDDGSKGYIIFLDTHRNWKTSLFGLIAVESKQDGYKIEELAGRDYVAELMISIDSEWTKIGRLILPDDFVWPELYSKSIVHKGKIFVYRYGESEPHKELNEGDDLENAQPKQIFFPGSLIKYYRKVLRKKGLYNKPEPIQKEPIQMTEMEEMSYAGVCGNVWSYYRTQINDKKKSITVATKATVQKFSDELSCSDTALQLYMGIAKAQLEFDDIIPEIKDEVLKRIEEEKNYLANEKWLSNQADKIKEELLKPKGK